MALRDHRTTPIDTFWRLLAEIQCMEILYRHRDNNAQGPKLTTYEKLAHGNLFVANVDKALVSPKTRSDLKDLLREYKREQIIQKARIMAHPELTGGLDTEAIADHSPKIAITDQEHLDRFIQQMAEQCVAGGDKDLYTANIQRKLVGARKIVDMSIGLGYLTDVALVHHKIRTAFGDLYPWERRTNEETLRELLSQERVDEKQLAQTFLKWVEETPPLQLQEPKNPEFPRIPAVQLLNELHSCEPANDSYPERLMSLLKESILGAPNERDAERYLAHLVELNRHQAKASDFNERQAELMARAWGNSANTNFYEGAFH